MAQTSIIGLQLESEAIDELREAGETDLQVITRVIYAAARPGMVGKHRVVERTNVGLEALDAAEGTARDARAAAELTAETNADAAVAAKLGG